LNGLSIDVITIKTTINKYAHTNYHAVGNIKYTYSSLIVIWSNLKEKAEN